MKEKVKTIKHKKVTTYRLFIIIRDIGGKKTKRFICTHRDTKYCSASITIKENKIIRSSNHINHAPMSDEEVKMFFAENNLKTQVT